MLFVKYCRPGGGQFRGLCVVCEILSSWWWSVQRAVCCL